MGKKKLDELFQEKFNDFEQLPDDKVWKAIEASLDKKKRRVIPLWWKLGGVAAVLAIGLFAINPFANSTDENPSVVDVEQHDSDSLERNNTKPAKILDLSDADETELTEANSQDIGEDTANGDADNPSKDTGSEPKKDVALSPGIKSKKKMQYTATQNEKFTKIDPKASTRITDVPDHKSNKDFTPKDNLEHLKENVQESVAEQVSANKSITDQSVEETIVQQGDNSNSIKNENGSLRETTEERTIARNDIEQNEAKVNEGAVEDETKKSIFDEINKQEEAVIAESEPRKRWSAGPSVAPVYFDAFGEGSPVHSILVPNSKSGETNLSYGLLVAYEISDRLSIRSGLHKVGYGYETGDIEFSSSLDGAITDQMNNIDYAATARTLVVKSKAGSTAVSVNESANDQAFNLEGANNSFARDGTMSQQFGYLEVPLELNYALVDRKVGINLIGGFSSLFLVNNSVSLTSGNQTTEMGEANNMNNLNFSTNIGLGIDYNFTPKVKLNIEPLFKYQLNTFSEVDGTFNPFSIGIYSGLSFKF